MYPWIEGDIPCSRLDPMEGAREENMHVQEQISGLYQLESWHWEQD